MAKSATLIMSFSNPKQLLFGITVVAFVTMLTVIFDQAFKGMDRDALNAQYKFKAIRFFR